ncbi:TPA: hypothetical protein DDZ86_01895 [Candidatus Dependentiae bacterium]|nr:MAG: 30S ribosomal protein S6 [candidate division TM6 bacterium GW2011_GWF2_43_87]HBL98377.1 hypothetical protein [Candidatus Dependentiae bacterium]
MSKTALARYEILFLTVPEITADETSTLESQLHTIISQAKGEILSFERWGKYRLAYTVRNNEYGVYFLARFDIPNEGLRAILDELRTFCLVKHHEVIMRHVISKLNPAAPLTYKRPESLEEMPRRDAEVPMRPYDAGMVSQDELLASEMVEEGRSGNEIE